MVSTITLVKIAGYGGIIVSTTGFYLKLRLIDRVRDYDYYKNAMKILRSHRGAVFYLGEPIRDSRFDLTDTKNNFYDGSAAQFLIPVKGPKDKGKYFIWAENTDEGWKVSKAELELKSKPDAKLVIVKGSS